METSGKIFSREALANASREDLIEEIYKLNVVLDINQLFSSDLNPDIVKNIGLLEAGRLTDAEYASIFLVTDAGDLEFAATTDPDRQQLEAIRIPMGKGIAGYVAQSGEIVNTANIQKDTRFYRAVDELTGKVTRSYLCIPLRARDRIIGTIQVINKKTGGHFAHADERILLTFAGQAAIAIETAILHEKAAEQERLAKENVRMSAELDVARRIQMSLLPSAPTLRGLEIAATMVPADEVGGDYYDVIETDAGQWLLIGDVSGHGVESGLIMMMTQTSIKSLVHKNQDANPASILSSVNRVLRENINRLGADRYMTISAIRINEDKLAYAGKHQDLLIYRSSTDLIESLPTSGTWLGIADDIGEALMDEEIEFSSGDMLVLFTDGITEATNAQDEMFGPARLIQLVRDHRKSSPQAVVDQIIHAVRDFAKKPDDDYTLLVMRKL